MSNHIISSLNDEHVPQIDPVLNAQNHQFTIFEYGYLNLAPGYKIKTCELVDEPANLTGKTYKLTLINNSIDEEQHKCPYCQGSNLYRHGESYLHIQDGLIFSYPVILKVPQYRLRCQNCGKTLTSKRPNWISSYGRITKRLESWVQILLMKEREISVRTISQITGVHWHLVKNIHKDMLKRKFSYIDTSKLRNIAMDEFAIKKGMIYATMIIDYDTRQPLFICEGRKKEDLQEFFDLLKKRNHANNIEGATMDANAGYAAIVKENCPNAKIILDQFHVVQNYNTQVIDKVRLNAAKQAAENNKDKVEDPELKHKLADGDRKIVKGLKWLVYKSYNKILTEAEAEPTLADLLKKNQNITKVCMMGDALKDCWRKETDPNKSRELVLNWITLAQNSGIKELIEFGRKLTRHVEEIIYAASTKLNTSILEGMNSKVKVIKRVARGYRDMEYFFLRIFQAFSKTA